MELNGKVIRYAGRFWRVVDHGRDLVGLTDFGVVVRHISREAAEVGRLQYAHMMGCAA
jgi:hypothetical protein